MHAHHNYPQSQMTDVADSGNVYEFQQFALVLMVQLPGSISALTVTVAH